MSSFQSVFQRLELKYPIDERAAERIRRDLEGYCVPDEHNQGVGKGYPLTSLYFDTHSMAFHRAKLRNDPDRYKLRARIYDETGPVQLEVKRKVVDVIRKTRVTVPRDTWREAARGVVAPLHDRPRDRELLDRFAHLLAQSGAEPRLLVHYDREAYVSTLDKYARVTFDRRILVKPTSQWAFDPPDWRWTELYYKSPEDVRSFLVLELKCETFMPVWMNELIRRHGLEISGFSKYSEGIRAVRSRELGISFVEDWGAYA